MYKFFRLFLVIIFITSLNTAYAMQQIIPLKKHMGKARRHEHSLQQQYTIGNILRIEKEDEIIYKINGCTKYGAQDSITVSKLKERDDIPAFFGTIIRDCPTSTNLPMFAGIDQGSTAQYWHECEQLYILQEKNKINK